MTAGWDPRFSTETNFRHLCKLKCCTSFSYCTQAFAKERSKSWVSSLLFLSEKVQSKICERCFLCHSVVLCKTCNKCQKCCLKSTCRSQTSKLLANLAESRGRSENRSDLEGRLHPPLPDPAKFNQVSHCHKPLCKPSQEQLPVRGVTSAYVQKCS